MKKGLYLNFSIISNVSLFLLLLYISNNGSDYVLVLLSSLLSYLLRNVFIKRVVTIDKIAKKILNILIVIMYLGIFVIGLSLFESWNKALRFTSYFTACQYFGFVYVYFKVMFEPSKQ